MKIDDFGVLILRCGRQRQRVAAKGYLHCDIEKQKQKLNIQKTKTKSGCLWGESWCLLLIICCFCCRCGVFGFALWVVGCNCSRR
jgi:hypothetical protein